jgi:hypothetical protein
MNNAYTILMRKPEENRSLGRPENIIVERILKSIVCADSTGIVQALNSYGAVMNRRFCV